MFCRKCGKELPDNSAFCTGCGSPTAAQDPVEDSIRDRKRGVPSLPELFDNARNALMETAEKGNTAIEDFQRKMDLKSLRPVFMDDLDSADFYLPKLIRITSQDEQHRKSKACIGSVGHETEQDGLRMLTVYPNKTQAFGMDLFPDPGGEFYYADPYVPGRFLNLDHYYELLLEMRVSELERISHDLGARHFSVTCTRYEQQNTAASNNTKVNVKLPSFPFGKKGVDVDRTVTEDANKEVKQLMRAKSFFSGGDPIMPRLEYFRNDPQIQTLIHFRMGDNTMTHREYQFRVGRSSGLNVDDVVKINTTLRKLGCSVNNDLVKAAKSEETVCLDYEIDF